MFLSCLPSVINSDVEAHQINPFLLKLLLSWRFITAIENLSKTRSLDILMVFRRKAVGGYRAGAVEPVYSRRLGGRTVHVKGSLHLAKLEDASSVCWVLHGGFNFT